MASTFKTPGEASLLRSAETEQARILRVPNEILGMIASECDPHDLKNLRLTCKFMNEISTPAFGRKAFCRRRFIFTRKSMQGLLDITAHPVLGPHLQCITFGSCRLRAARHDGDDEIDIYPYYNNYSDVNLASYMIKEAMHRAFVEKDEHLEMLTLALRNLQACSNHGVHFGVHDDSLHYQVKRRAYGFEDAYGRAIPTRFDGVETLSAIFAASASSGYPIEAIKLFVSQEHLSTLLQGSDILWGIFNDEDTNGLGLNPDVDVHIGIRLNTTYAKLKTLRAGTRLELSSHSFERDADGNPYLKFCEANYGLVWEAISSSPLRDVVVEKADVEYDMFTRFLGGQAESLNHLVLRDVHVLALDSPTETTSRLLRFLSDDLGLESLTLERLTVGKNILVPEIGKVVFHGRENVIKGLEDMIEEVDVTYEDEQSEQDSFDGDELLSSE